MMCFLKVLLGTTDILAFDHIIESIWIFGYLITRSLVQGFEIGELLRIYHTRCVNIITVVLGFGLVDLKMLHPSPSQLLYYHSYFTSPTRRCVEKECHIR